MTKTIKIPIGVHRELKIFVADLESSMNDIAGFAIMEYLQRQGHKFTKPSSKQLSKPKK